MTSDYETVAGHMSSLGLEPPPTPWQGVDAVLPLLEHLRRQGLVVVIKLDGERASSGDKAPYTLVLSGAPLEGDFIRLDGSTLEDTLAAVLAEYARKVG